MSGRGAISPLRGLLGQLWYYGSLRGLASDNFLQLHAGVVGGTIVGINNALSSVLCVEPQIPISLHDRTSTSSTGVHLNASYERKDYSHIYDFA